MNVKPRRVLACTLCAFLLVWTASAMAQEPEPAPAPTPEQAKPEEAKPVEPEHPPISPSGAQSDLLQPEAAQRMTQSGPRPDMTEFPGCGHAPSMSNPQDISLLRRVLVELLGQSAPS